MQHENTVFHALTKHIDWSRFDRLVSEHRADYRVRRLSTKSQFVALLYGQLSGSRSLREIEAALASHGSRLYHLGATAPSRSTLADANAKRPWQVFAELFTVMAGHARPGVRRKMRDVVRLIDATKLKLTTASADWARFCDGFSAAKLHVVYDPLDHSPLVAEVTPDNVNDITPTKRFPIEAGATYVFDLAYYDFGWWAELDAQGCRFVSRLKTHTKLNHPREREVTGDRHILSDRVGYLHKRIGQGRANPYTDPVREITLRIQTGKILRLVTNDLDAPAQDIADLYKMRWQIELFFKWIKQNLKIKHFLGTSENAVRIQLFVALICYLIIRAAHDALNSVTASPMAFARLVRANLMHRRALSAIHRPDRPPTCDSRQTQLALCIS